MGCTDIKITPEIKEIWRHRAAQFHQEWKADITKFKGWLAGIDWDDMEKNDYNAFIHRMQSPCNGVWPHCGHPLDHPTFHEYYAKHGNFIMDDSTTEKSSGVPRRT